MSQSQEIALERLLPPKNEGNNVNEKKEKIYTIRAMIRRRSPQERWEYEEEGVPLLRRVLTWIDVLCCSTCMTIGAGIFVIAGLVAKNHAGPAVVLSLLLSGIAALISSFSYGEFSSRIPVSGSTYSFVYISLGEFMGWTAGWITILEYFGGAAVAKGIATACYKIASGITNQIIALVVILILTLVVVLGGIKTAAVFCRFMSSLTISTILFIGIAGAMSIKVSNWAEFAPFGFSGIVRGAAQVFFAYIGFENSTSLATEVKDPKRSMPSGVIGTLLLTVVLYFFCSLVLVGMINYTELTDDTPFVDAFLTTPREWAAIIVGVGSLLCMITAVFAILLGLPRILYQMSKDGLLGEYFARLNERRVPYLGTILIGVIIMLLTFVPLQSISDMVCTGVLLNYTLINISVIALRFRDSEIIMEKKHFFILLATGLSCIIVGVAVTLKGPFYIPMISLVPFIICMIVMYFKMPVDQLSHPPHVDSFKCPMVPFLPCLGILFNIVMVVQLQVPDHSDLVSVFPILGVFGWVVIGSIVYFAYGIRNSRLNEKNPEDRFYY